ncbi:MAG: DEAD/DEAH box helicase [Thiotrichales bacterium]|nr:DEAD/DEAH box helicase [Thiotrichales bacterium]
MTFEEFDLAPELLTAIAAQGYHKPTPIQAQAIPAMLERVDVLAGAATGTGKTAAFVIPALQYLLDEPEHTVHPRVLILAPTRELAVQIHQGVRALAAHTQVRSAMITGGFNQGNQVKTLRQSTDILVATPGRLAKMMEEDQVNLSYIELLIIDEADRMLDMGQGPTVRTLLESIPGDFQAGLFSATLSGAGVRKFAEDILDEPVEIQIEAPNQHSSQIQQITYLANDLVHKNALLLNLLQDASCASAIVFCNKKERAIALTEYLQSQNISAQVLHGDFIQAVRLEKMHKFKTGKIKVMVATDVAARGLDMLNITHVINYDLPYRGDIYIHRIGRTGRAQQVGISINLVERHDLKALERIEYHLQQSIPVGKIAGLEANYTRKAAKEAQAKAQKKKPKKNAKKKK